MARYRRHRKHSALWNQAYRTHSYKKCGRKKQLFKVSKPRRSYSTTYVSPTNVNTTTNNTNNAKQTEDTMLMVGLSIALMFIICVVSMACV